MASLAKVAHCSRLRLPEAVGVTCVVRRNGSTSVTVGNYKRGTGGRSSFSGTVATVFGANGYLGRSVVNSLGKVGSQIIIPYRGDTYETKDLAMKGDLGQILFNKFHLRDEDSIRKCMKYSNVVVNLIGQEYETRNFTFEDVHVDGARRLARLAREAGVQKFVHISHLNAGVESNNIKRGGSQYLATKLAGEQAVREEFPDAIILRPSYVIGMSDKFVFYFIKETRYIRQLNMLAQPAPILRIMPLWKKGYETTVAPVHVSDFSKGIMAALNNPECVGKTIQMYGPRAYTLNEIVSYIQRCKRQEIPISNIHFYHLRFRAKMMEFVFRKINFPTPKFTTDLLERETVSDRIDPSLMSLEDLGISPKKVEDSIEFILRPYRPNEYYNDELGEFPPPERPEISYTTLSS